MTTLPSFLTGKDMLIKNKALQAEVVDYYQKLGDGQNVYGAIKTLPNGEKKMYLEDCDTDIGFGIYRVFSDKESCDHYIRLISSRTGIEKGSFMVWSANVDMLVDNLAQLDQESSRHFGKHILATSCVYTERVGFVLIDLFWSGNKDHVV